MLSVQSRACIQAASELYCGIVDEVEKIDYQIFSKRAKTSNMAKNEGCNSCLSKGSKL